MEKGLCWGSMGISGVLLVLFLLDLVMQIPFGGLSRVVDILGTVSCGLVLYMGWNAAKDLH